MKRSAVATIPLSLCLMLATAASAQAPPEAPLAPSNGAASFGTELRDEFLGHFERSSYKISELARVMPEDLYT